jgi:hypothetical protein
MGPGDPLPDLETLGDDRRTGLAQRVGGALLVLPGFFEFGTRIEGIDATDLFSLNSVLGTSIEVQVVHTLNKMRSIWDPDEEWVGYRFERQSQTFPDVRLVRRSTGEAEIAMGIELKGWYLLSKEGVPSLRFQTTPAACSPFDLIASCHGISATFCPGRPSLASHGYPERGMQQSSATTGGSMCGKPPTLRASRRLLAYARIRQRICRSRMCRTMTEAGTSGG